MSEVAAKLREHELVVEVIPSIPEDIELLDILYEETGTRVHLGDELTPSQVTKRPKVSYKADPNKLYTLMFIDPDGPSRTDPNKHLVKHWMVFNIPGNQVEQGHEDAEYVGCGPPDGSGLHRYVFFLYEQPAKIPLSTPSNRYTLKRRVPFSPREFAFENNLGQPIAAAFFQAKYDESCKQLTKQMLKFPYVFSNFCILLSMKFGSK